MGDRDGSVVHAATTVLLSTSPSITQDRREHPPSPAQFPNRASHERDRDRSLTPKLEAASPMTHNELLAQPHKETMAQLDIPAAKFASPVEDPSFSQMDTALRYGIFLEISHKGDYIMAINSLTTTSTTKEMEFYRLYFAQLSNSCQNGSCGLITKAN